MKGQHLFVRPIEPGDYDAVSQFLAREGDPSAAPTFGLLGKLVGDLVAVLAMQVTTDSLLVSGIVVARDLRRKRIGRVMLDEAEQIAARIDRPQLAVEESQASAGFLQRVGFEREGSRWIRKVRP